MRERPHARRGLTARFGRASRSPGEHLCAGITPSESPASTISFGRRSGRESTALDERVDADLLSVRDGVQKVLPS
jgi:hypothetical protein